METKSTTIAAYKSLSPEYIESHERIIVRSILENGPQTREQLSKSTGLRIPAVTPRVTRLSQVGVLEEKGTAINETGMAAFLLHVTEAGNEWFKTGTSSTVEQMARLADLQDAVIKVSRSVCVERTQESVNELQKAIASLDQLIAFKKAEKERKRSALREAEAQAAIGVKSDE